MASEKGEVDEVVVAVPLEVQPSQPTGVKQEVVVSGQYQATPLVSYQAPPVVIMQPGMAVGSPSLQCMRCGQTGNCQVMATMGTMQILWAVILLFAFWPLVCLPFIMTSCYDQRYVCRNCGTVVYQRSGGTC